MILYDFSCVDGHRFEAMLPSSQSHPPECPTCGSPSRRCPAFGRMTGRGDPGPSRDEAPKSWRAVGNGDRETVRHWHSQMVKRERLEERYPELAGDRRPILAHEGRFAANPLRAGDPIPSDLAGSKTGPGKETQD